jgi:hypothetical protein
MITRTAWLLLLGFLLAGCGAGDKEARARAVADGYLQALQEKDWDQAMTFYAKRFFETRSPEVWKKDLQLIIRQLGSLQTYRLKSWKWRSDFIPPDSGTHVTLTYEVKYSKHTAMETFTVFKPFARGDYKIWSHMLSSGGFMKD